MCHFLTFFSSCALRLICDTDWTHIERNQYLSMYNIIQVDDRHFFFILYIKIHAQILYNTIPSFMYLFNHGLHDSGDWLSLPLIGAIGIKKKMYTVFVNTVTLYFHYVVFVFMNKIKIMGISVLLSGICWYLTIRLPFIEVCLSLTKAFSNSLKADRPYTCIEKWNVL